MKASEYKKHALKKSEIFDVALPSGAVWKMRKPSLEPYIASGRLPATLTAKMLSAVKQAKGGGLSDDLKSELLEQLTVDEMIDNLAFGCELIAASAVEPRIVVKPDANGLVPEDAILPTDILPEDFEYLLKWVMTGGVTGAGPSKFS